MLPEGPQTLTRLKKHGMGLIFNPGLQSCVAHVRQLTNYVLKARISQRQTLDTATCEAAPREFPLELLIACPEIKTTPAELSVD